MDIPQPGVVVNKDSHSSVALSGEAALELANKSNLSAHELVNRDTLSGGSNLKNVPGGWRLGAPWDFGHSTK